MTAIVTVANRKPMSLNPLRSAIAMLRLTEKSNVGAEKTFLNYHDFEDPVFIADRHLAAYRQLDIFV